MYCGRPSTRGAAVHKILFYPLRTAARILRQFYIWMPQYTREYLVYCGLCTMAATVHDLVYCSNLVYWGAAAVGVDAPQYKPFYTVPMKSATTNYLFHSSAKVHLVRGGGGTLEIFEGTHLLYLRNFLFLV